VDLLYAGDRRSPCCRGPVLFTALSHVPLIISLSSSSPVVMRLLLCHLLPAICCGDDGVCDCCC
jgi:hypothetical protein